MRLHLPATDMTKPKQNDGARSRTDAAYFGSVLGLIDAASPNLPALQVLLDARPINARELCELVAALRKLDASNRQRQHAEKKHQKRRKAIEYARALWLLEPRKNGAKKAFSERISLVVLERFSIEAKPETIARDWLRGCATPPGAWGNDWQYSGA